MRDMIKQATILNLIQRFIKRSNNTEVNTIGLTIYYINLIKLNEGI